MISLESCKIKQKQEAKMRKKIRDLNQLVDKILLIACFALLSPTILNAEPIKPNITNIGFMKNPPQKLKKKFPMCDAFLKVTWIDKKNKIGYSKYNAYENDRKYGSYLALIHLDEKCPHYRFNIKNFQKTNFQKLSSFIKQGTIEPYCSDEILNIKSKSGENIELVPYYLIYSFANRLLNVCIPYPDNQRMWISEMPNLETKHTEQEIKDITRKIKSWIPDFLDGFFDFAIATIDFNFDGIDDYFGIPMVYSNGDRYSKTMIPMWKNVNDINHVLGLYSFPPTQTVCKVMWQPYLTTDGKNYFLNNYCNLTKLTTRGK